MATCTAAHLFCARSQTCTQSILEAKKRLNKTWEQIAEAVGLSPVFVTSVCLGENSLHEPEAEKLVKFLGISDPTVKETLMACDLKAQTRTADLLQDPCIYRLHEATIVYGLSIKELIQEKFGDGIMSAIDFEVYVDKEENPKGDRVKITMSGKYLPYRKF